MKKSLVLLIIVLVGVFVFLTVGLKLNPHDVPSPLIGKPVPEFSANTLLGSDTFSNQDLLGKVALVNVWATWCPSCRAEHDVLMRIAKTSKVQIYGINWKDQTSKAIEWLQQLGNPYIKNADDLSGDIGIDFGVYGAPETYIIDYNGIIAYKHTGPIQWSDWQDKILPEIEKLTPEK